MAESPGALDRPVGLLEELGVELFRFEIPWRELAPRRPGLTAYDGAAASDAEWAGYRWARLDTIVDALGEAGIAPVPVLARAPAAGRSRARAIARAPQRRRTGAHARRSAAGTDEPDARR